MEGNKIKAIFILVVAASFAVYLGFAAATARFEAIAWVAGFAGLAVILGLGSKVWVLVPLALSLQGALNALPGSPPPWAVATAATVTMFAARFALRRPDFNWRFTWLDAAVLLQLVAVGQAYLRNPTGLMMFGGDMAGGKPYFIFGLAVVAYFCVSVAKPDLKTVRMVLIASIGLYALDGLLSTISDRSGFVAATILPIYSNVNLGVALGGGAGMDYTEVRGGAGFAQFGRAMVLPCFCLVRPIQCLNPFRPILFGIVMVGCVLVLLSGFRSGIAYLAVVFVVSALIRRRVIDVAAVTLFGLLALALVLMTGQVRSLPFGVQRILSVLPVDVEAAARVDAENSTEWRIEMWKMALGTDRYIENKVLGDGFTMSSREMRAILDNAAGFSNYMDSSQEQALAKGSYHGFHVETIRFTGIVGLACALFLMFAAFSVARRCLKLFRGDPFFPYVVFLAMSFLIFPFWSMLVFGGYRAEFPQFIAMAGLLKMVENLALQRKVELVEQAPAMAPIRSVALSRA
jgi:hypothetical protein